MGATQDGKLVALRNDILQHTSLIDPYVENCVEGTSMLYSCPNLSAEQQLVPTECGDTNSDARAGTHAGAVSRLNPRWTRWR